MKGNGSVESRECSRNCNMVRANPGAALDAARRLSAPQMRCLALAWVARFTATDRDALKIANEAEEAAKASADPCEGAAGTAWVVRALVERDRTADADAALARAVALAQNVANPNLRVEALLLLVQAGWPLESRSWEAAVSALAGGGRVAASAKTSSVLRDLVLMLAAEGRDHTRVLAAIPEGKYKRQVERRLESRAYMSPRPFFW